jgi:hypothetical protein
MRMITDDNGLLIKYSWSTLTSSIIYDATERPSLFAKIPPHQLVSSEPTPGMDAGSSMHSNPFSAEPIDQSAIDAIDLTDLV